MGKRINSDKKSTIKDYCLLLGHVYSFDNFTILNYESHKFKGNVQFVQKVTFEPLMDFKQNHYGNWKYYESYYF